MNFKDSKQRIAGVESEPPDSGDSSVEGGSSMAIPGILSEGYGIIPKKIMRDKRLDVYQKAVLSYMLSFTGGGSECFPGIKSIHEDLQISKTTVIRSINGLEILGYLKRERKYPNDPLKHNNKYLMLFSSESPRSEPSRCPVGTSEVSVVDKNINNTNINSINKDTEPRKTSDSVPSLLPTFHKVYTDFLTEKGLYFKETYPGAKNGGIFKKLEKMGVSAEQLRSALDNYARDNFGSQNLENLGLFFSKWGKWQAGSGRGNSNESSPEDFKAYKLKHGIV